ncbi:MAG: DUF2147 domain-containing protein [Bacteroidales bacterium]|jgi:uncharacterized protein (DUF2147 family)|nr:DUF2147 domain-containing protein [Bacteroidales bacterium]
MRKHIFMVFLALCLGALSQQVLLAQKQNNPDDITGYYLSVDPFNYKKSQNYIYKDNDGTYHGVVTWVEDPTLQSFVGYEFLTGLTFNAKENEWQNGVLKYPGKSGTFKTYMSFKENLNTLKVRGYYGVSLFGKTVYWTREKKR